MISPKKLVKISRSSAPSLAGAGHFVIYTVDHKRFDIPLAFLNSSIFVHLFKISEETFGLPSKGPIKLPCDAIFMEHIISLVRKGLVKDAEKVLVTFLEATQFSHSFAFHQEDADEPLLACGI